MRVDQIECVVFDVETTGLSPLEGDRVIEIAAIKVKEGKVVATIESLINPQRSIPLEAQRINHISDDMLIDAPTAQEFLPKMIDFIGGTPLAGHNIKFDLDFLCYELSLIGRKLKDTTPAIDTIKMAKRLLPQLSTYRLQNLAQYFGANVQETHRALADVKLTVTVITRLLDLAIKQGFTTPQDIFKEFGVTKPNFKIAEANQDVLF
ncbi:MAG TPA: 3'-5' exonuclease [Candidatus Omnitrophota bacterium]|nr:3'-5' exonuclease [Candidatus Omnitrophota bacterium]